MDENDEALRAVATRRVQARMGFMGHALTYVVVMAGLWLIWSSTGRGYRWPLWPMFGWGAAVVVHGVMLLIGPDTAREERAVEREMRRLRERPQTT